ncbi:probable terpene synthase 2 [Impatiens glandulifera]|uniref:probable terpene synthase 2 n=1 Tax=Impatiens glandulifera TaxID=253017 RepID=UPI001FB0BF01|nr:probable terpene synthase 2 [Impatiens glandulifera]
MSTKVVEVMTGIARPRANFHASVWGDFFLKYTSTTDSKDNELKNKIHSELKEKLRKKLISPHSIDTSLSEKLNFIDNIQRLGVSYHFENEIEQIIQRIYIDKKHISLTKNEDVDLHNCALLFRLLRHQGYNVSAVDVFKKFLDINGEFKTSIKNDMKGMLSLHEATQLRLPGEDILEKALNFITKIFENMLLQDHHDIIDHKNPYLSQQVTNALNQSLHKGMIRIEARKYFPIYENYNTHDNKLLEFAKLDYNILQRMYQRELAELTRWWKDLDFVNKCPFARDRLVEGYFCTLAIYFEPQYSYSRKMATKMIAFLSVLDDIYDAYGTWEELVILTDAINRYTEYMKVMSNIFLKEASWLHTSYIPTLEEYMNVSLISSGARFLSINLFIGMNPTLATKEVFDWAFEDPPILKAIAIIIRLIDDSVGFKFEQEREHVVSAVQCYMHQHDVSEDIAISQLKMKVIDAWKVINSELIRPTKVSRALLTHVVGIARFMEVLYKEGDGYTHPQSKGKEILSYVLVNPVDV